jgi:hypothetical protein
LDEGDIMRSRRSDVKTIFDGKRSNAPKGATAPLIVFIIVAVLVTAMILPATSVRPDPDQVMGAAAAGGIGWADNFGGDDYEFFYAVTAVDGGVVAVGVSLSSITYNDKDGSKTLDHKGGGDAIIVMYDNNGNIVWADNFGGDDYEAFSAVTAVDGGVVAVGQSWSSIPYDDKDGNKTLDHKGGGDAIIVKYDLDGNIEWADNFGGDEYELFRAVTTVDGGVVVVGFSYSSIPYDDKNGIKTLDQKGNADAIIVKYDLDGNIEWADNFGGDEYELFRAVTAVDGGVVVVGFSYSSVPYDDKNGSRTLDHKGGGDAIIVMYDNNGNIVWADNFGGDDYDEFLAVTTVDGGVVDVGHTWSSIPYDDKNGSRTLDNKGSAVAIIVKYDLDGNIEWADSFGGDDYDEFQAVTAVDGGVVAVGFSFSSIPYTDKDGSKTLDHKGSADAIIVMYDNDGNIEWADSFGGDDSELFRAVTAVDGGVVAVGSSYSSIPYDDKNGSKTLDQKGGGDAIIVMYDNNGNIEWADNFGGDDHDTFIAVTTVDGGVVAVGFSFSSIPYNDKNGNRTLDNKGDGDAIIVMYDNNGNIEWADNFGGDDYDEFQAVTAVDGGVVAVGFSYSSIPYDDKNGSKTLNNKDCYDAIIVRYGITYDVTVNNADTDLSFELYYDDAGTWTAFTAPRSLAAGTEVKVVAVYDPVLYTFEWTGDLASKTGDTVFWTLNDDLEVSGTLERKIYTVTVTYTEGGSFRYAIDDWANEVIVPGTTGGTEVIDVPAGHILLIEALPRIGYDVSLEDDLGYISPFTEYASGKIMNNGLNITITFSLPDDDDPGIPWLLLMIIALIGAVFLLILLDDDDPEIYGKVTHDGKGVAGAAITYTLNGATDTATTDADGDYSIDVDIEDDIIIANVSKGGLVSPNVPISLTVENERTNLNFEISK